MNTEIEQAEIIVTEEIETTPSKPTLSPAIAFGKAHGMKVMSLGFVIFGAGVFLNLYTHSAQWTSALAFCGFSVYVVGRILHAVSRKR